MPISKPIPEIRCEKCEHYIGISAISNSITILCNRTLLPVVRCISKEYALFLPRLNMTSNKNHFMLAYDNPQDPFYVLFEQLTEEELREQLNDVGIRLVNYSNSVTLRDISKHQEPEYLKLKEESRLLSNRLIAVVKEKQRKDKLKN